LASPITIPGFVDHLADAFARWRAYEQQNSRQMANEFALAGQHVYPGAAYDFARHGTNLTNANPDALAALIAILRSGGGWIRG